MKIPDVMRDGRVVLEYDMDRDEVRITYDGNIVYLKQLSTEDHDAFANRVINFVQQLKIAPADGSMCNPWSDEPAKIIIS